MPNDRDRTAAWWAALDHETRAQVIAAGRYLPTTVAHSLANAGVAVSSLDPGVPGVPKQYVTPKALRSLVAEQREAASNN